MFRRSIKRVSNRPGIAIGIVLIGIVAATGIALLFANEQPKFDTDAEIEPRAARIERVEGTVLIGDFDESQEPDWAEATVNAPVTVGDRIFARDDSQASIALTGRNYVEVKSGGSLDVLSLTNSDTQLALRSGSALFNIGELNEDELFEVATPSGAVDFVQPGLYQIGFDGDNAVVSVLRGLAQLVGEGGSEYINQGQVITLGANGDEALASTLEPTLAGGIVDDYYRESYPETYDGRYSSYDDYLEDPYYYDTYQGSRSYDYLPVDIPGVRDLDYYGEWTDVDGYGHCWTPRVSDGWAPFREGYWDADSFWGPTWVSNEPWGWAPYHYGRWTFVNQRWFWVPVEVVRQPVYCPATVAFVSLNQADQIGWVPLAPGEAYVPRYYDSHFQPQYLAPRNRIREVTVQHTFVNLNAPSGITVVPVHALRNRIDSRVITHVDSRVIANQRAALDPFAIDGFRQLALRKQDARQRVKLARIERRALNRQVVTSRKPAFLSQRAEAARGLRAEQISETRKKNKLKVAQTGQVVNARRPDGLPQFQPDANAKANQERKTALAARANQGDKSARRELRKILRQEQQAGSNPEAGKQPVTNPPASQSQTERKQLRKQVKKQLKLQQQQKAKTVERKPPAQQPQARPQPKQPQQVNRQQQSRPVQKQQRPQQVKPQQPKQPKRKPSGIASQQTPPAAKLNQKQTVQQQAVTQQQKKASVKQAPPSAKTHQPTAVQKQVVQKQQSVKGQGKVKSKKNQ